jgi:hypothetical protein
LVFSTSPGVRVFATVTPLFAWYVLTYAKKTRPLFGLCLGLAHALAVLGHQTNILLLPAFLGGIWLIEEKSAWDKTKLTLYYLSSLTVGVLAVYGFVGRFACYRITYPSWVWWVFSYFHVQQWGGNLDHTGFNMGGFAMVKAFLQETQLTKTMETPFTFLTAQTILVYALWVLLGALVLRFKAIWENQKQVLWVSFLWLLAFVPFFIWWEPWNIEFWVSSTVPCWILMGVVVSSLSQSFSQPVLRFANRAVITCLWAGVIALLFFYNFNNVVNALGQPAAAPEVKTTVHAHQLLLDALDWKVNKHDLLILNGMNTIPFYIDRYKKRDYLNLHTYLRKYQKAAIEEKEAEKKNSDKAKPVATPEPLDPWGDLTNLMKDRWAHHRKVWVMTEVVDEKDEWRMKLEKLMGLPLGHLTDYFKGFELKPVVYKKNVYFYEIIQPEVPTPEPTDEPEMGKGKSKR